MEKGPNSLIMAQRLILRETSNFLTDADSSTELLFPLASKKCPPRRRHRRHLRRQRDFFDLFLQLLGDSDKRLSLIIATFVGNFKGDITKTNEFMSL